MLSCFHVLLHLHSRLHQTVLDDGRTRLCPTTAWKCHAAHAALLAVAAGQQAGLHALSLETHLPSAGGGKTQCCSMLRDALCLLARQQDSTSGYQSVQTLTLNPKSISLGELFGEYNAVTNEWRDGIASVLIRGAVSDEGPGHKWVVFDGPVDAVWVENMNTVGLVMLSVGCADGCCMGIRPSVLPSAYVTLAFSCRFDAGF